VAGNLGRPANFTSVVKKMTQKYKESRVGAESEDEEEVISMGV
jgi:hypothetical protein